MSLERPPEQCEVDREISADTENRRSENSEPSSQKPEILILES